MRSGQIRALARVDSARFALTLALALSPGILAACGGNGDAPRGSGHSSPSQPQPSPSTAASPPASSASPPPGPPQPPVAPPNAAPPTRPALEPPDGLAPLIEGHNDLTADRINLVAATSGWEEHRQFVAYAKKIFSPNGQPLLLDDRGQITTVSSEAVEAIFGVFSIEPWRSNLDLFNLWYLTDQADDPAPTLNRGADVSGLPDELVVYFVPDFEFDSVAGLTSFVPPDLPDRQEGFFFGDVLIDVPSSAPYSAATTVAHEIGHGLFGLSDEYVGDRLGWDGRPDLTSYPACAENRAEAKAFWGDLKGAVDPMFDTRMETLE